MSRHYINTLIVDGKYSEAIDSLRNILTESHWQTQITMLEGQYRSLRRNLREGIVPSSERVIQENLLRKNLLELVQEAIDQSLLSDTPHSGLATLHNSEESGQRTLPKKAIWMAAILALCGVLIYFMWFYLTQKEQPQTLIKQVSQQESQEAQESKPLQTHAPVSNPKRAAPVSSSPSARVPVQANILKVSSNIPEHEAFLESAAGAMLRSAGISVQSGTTGIVQRLHFNFDLKKSRTQSGFRDALKCTLHLVVEVSAPNGSVCKPISQYASKTLIAFPEDSPQDILEKVIMPGMEEIKKAFDYSPVQLCPITN